MADLRIYQAAVITAPKKPIELWKYEVLPPGRGCVKIAVLRAGVCGTDLHLWQGDSTYDEPFILGHEGLGRILELGEGVSKDSSSAPIAVGDVVYWNPIRPCYACYECTIERDLTGCTNGTFTSPARSSTTWASYTQIATLQPSNAFYRVDPDVPLDAFISLGCALPTMLKGLENMGPIKRGSAVLIQGCGAVGLASIMLAMLAGARAIIVIESNPLRLEMARKFGATEVLDMSSPLYRDRESRAKRISKVTGTQGLELAIECSGHSAAVEEGLGLVKRNGRYLLVGTWAGAGTVPLSPFEVVHKALKIIGTTYASPENYYQAARLVEANHRTFPLAECVTHHFALCQVEEGLKAVANGEAIKVVIEPQK
jgi:threonine dehydrogenase-like Zn-dependent dehydrogenase